MATSGITSLFVIATLIFSFFEGENAKILAKSKSSGPIPPIMFQKMQKLVELMDEKRGRESIEMSVWDYRELVFDSPRNHTTFVLFYNDQDKCESCGTIVQAFDKIAHSFTQHYTKYYPKSLTRSLLIPVFFAKIRMTDGHRHMLVDVDPSRPSLFYFAPARSSKYNQFEQMDKEMLVPELGEQFNVERMLGFIERISELQIPMEKEKHLPDFLSTLLTASMLGIMILFNIYHFGYWNQFINVLKQGNYTYFITVIVIWLLSGQMFNYIRYTPMFGPHGISLSSLIYPGSRSQYGCESIIVMILYAMIMYAITSLVETRERQLSENLSMRDVQGSILGALSTFYFGFMAIQFISQIKTGRY